MNRFKQFSSAEKIVLHYALIKLFESENYTDKESVIIEELMHEIDKVRPIKT